METKEENDIEIKEENEEKPEDTEETKDIKKQTNEMADQLKDDEIFKQIRESNKIELEKENNKPKCQCKCVIF